MLIRPGRFAAQPVLPSLFGRPGPLVLEVGFGDGQFLVQLARNHPDWNLLGVEISLASLSRAWRRLRREHVQTARLFHGHARFVAHSVIPPGTLHRVYVNFPDPWPRPRHHGNRLLQVDFLRMLSTRLMPGGSLWLTTDHADYFAWSCRQADLAGCYALETPPPPPETLATKYALKWQEDRRTIQHVRMTVTNPAPPHPPQTQLLPMQHALLNGSLDELPAFEKRVHSFRGGAAIVSDAYRSIGGNSVLFTVVVEEADLRQEVLIKAWPKDGGVYVGILPFGDPLGTRGTREAVHAVIGWLTDQGLSVRQTWI